MTLRDQIYDQLRTVFDPELGINVVDLGLIYDVKVDDNKNVEVTMTLTTPGCPLHDSISSGVKHAVHYLDEVEDVQVNIVWNPPWSPERMSPEALRQLQGR